MENDALDLALDRALEHAVKIFAIKLERLVARMLMAWDYERWGEPTVAIFDNSFIHVTNGLDGPPRLVSGILGLCRAATVGKKSTEILVLASDHEADNGEPINTDGIIARLRMAQAEGKPDGCR